MPMPRITDFNNPSTKRKKTKTEKNLKTNTKNASSIQVTQMKQNKIE
jgi:hypothetical protein